MPQTITKHGITHNHCSTLAQKQHLIQNADILPYCTSLTRAGEDEWLGGVHGDAPDVVRVGLEHVQTLQSVVVEDAHAHVVRARHDPVLARHELGGAHGKVAHLE